MDGTSVTAACLLARRLPRARKHSRPPPCPPPCPTQPRPLRSYGAFWMSLAIFSTLSAGGVFVATPEKGDRLMLVLWGILVSAAGAGMRPRCLPACLLARARACKRALSATPDAPG